jgi:AraC family transcriptional regulator of arabinose operon
MSQSSVWFQSTQTTSLGQILLVGSHLNLQPVPAMAMRVWDIYSLVYILDGKGWFFDIAGRELPVQSGDLMMMFPGHGYRYHADPTHAWSELYLQFYGPIFDVWREEGLITPTHPVIHLHPIAYWRRQLQGVAVSHAANDSAQMLTRVITLQAVLEEMVRHAAQLPHNEREWLLQAEAVLMNVPLNDPIQWTELASALYLSADRFRKKFQALAGVSPSRYLAQRRCDEASRLLHQTTLSLGEIAECLGYYDASHFYRHFKQYTGLSPNDYRAVCRTAMTDVQPCTARADLT